MNSDVAVQQYLSNLFGTEDQAPDKTAAEEWLEKIAGSADKEIKDPGTEENMSIEDKLNKLDLDTLVKLTQNITDEKVAAETEPDMSEEDAAKILGSISKERLEEALANVEKTAEKDPADMTALEYLQQLSKDQSLEKEAGEELDLTTISGADLIAGLESGEIELEGLEKEAKETEEGEEIDLSTISGADLIAGLESGEIELEGLEKEAGTDESVELDLTKISAQELIAGVESGEIVLVDEDLEKGAESEDDQVAESFYTLGKIMSQGLMDGLTEQNETQEKTAEAEEELLKKYIVDLLSEELGHKKEAGSIQDGVNKLIQFFNRSKKTNVVSGSEGNREGYKMGKGKVVAKASHRLPYRTGGRTGAMAGGLCKNPIGK
jgi:hypothetical protein